MINNEQWFASDNEIIAMPSQTKIAKVYRISETDNGKANAQVISKANQLLEALQGIIEIGKRDLTNPKYDHYFKTAKEVIKKATL